MDSHSSQFQGFRLSSTSAFRSVLSFPKSVCFSYHFASLCFVATPPVWHLPISKSICMWHNATLYMHSPQYLGTSICVLFCAWHLTVRCIALHSGTKKHSSASNKQSLQKEWRWLFHCFFCHLPCCRIWFSCSIINMIMLLVSTDSHHQQTSNTCYCAPKLPHPWLAPFPPRLC